MQKRKIRLLSLLALSLVTLSSVGCDGGKGDSSSPSIDSTSSSSSSSSSSSTLQPSGPTIHEETGPADLNIYLLTDASYSYRDWVWAWDGVNSYGFQVSGDSYVIFDELGESFEFIPVHINFDTDYSCYVTDWAFTEQGTLNFASDLSNMITGIIFRAQDGSSQTADLIIDPTQLVPDEDGNYNILIDEKSAGVYYSVADFPTTPIDSVTYTGTVDEESGTSYAIEVKGEGLNEVFAGGQPYLRPYRFDAEGNRIYADNINLDLSSAGTGNTSKSIVLTAPLDLTYRYEFWCSNPNKGGQMENVGDVNVKRFYSSAAFDATYYTDEELGALVEGGTTTFRLWSPTATAVKLHVYSDDSQALGASTDYDLTRDEHGVFSVVIPQNLNGHYYQYEVTNFGRTVTTADPYARSSNANGVHSMVVDFADTTRYEGYTAEETGWAPDTVASDTTIMEMHTKDMTYDQSWNGTEANRGRFLGLAESGTKLEDGTPTGFDYVKNLHAKGLTHVQIMPAYDFASVDETQDVTDLYNWGYDPQQYNAPEGSYSSNPNDGTTRVAEFQDWIKAYNEAGIGVIMDVVYNHMPGQNGTAFENVFPGYYFRSASFSGAGTDLASQRSMVRQFIVDSVVGWVRDYHVSGFRFDLMGILDWQTMVAVRQALDAIDPNILVYGEGWTMFGSDSDSLLTAADMATQNNINKMGDDWTGAFNDTYRDGMKGSVFDAYGKGYVQKAFEGDSVSGVDKDKIYYGMTGTYYLGHSGGFTYAPAATDGMSASLAYVECHDNATLHDTLMLSADDQSDVPQMIELANANVLGSLAPAFFQVGQDFGRSKEVTEDSPDYRTDTCYEDQHEGRENIAYNHNSYNSSAQLNAVKWNLLTENREISDSFNANLELRGQRHFAEGTRDTFQNESTFTPDLIDDSGVLSFTYTVDDQTYLFIQNYTDEPVTYEGHTVAAHDTLALLA